MPTSYAVVPNYQASYAPYAPFNTAAGSLGYVSSGLQLGEQIYLGAGSGLPAGTYTLLPSSYALLPGAFLITPHHEHVRSRPDPADGSSLVSGYLFNGLSNPGGVTGTLVSQFQVASQSVVLSRGNYETYLASSFLSQGATQSGNTVPLLPTDAGQLNFEASSSLVLQGTVNGVRSDRWPAWPDRYQQRLLGDHRHHLRHRWQPVRHAHTGPPPNLARLAQALS